MGLPRPGSNTTLSIIGMFKLFNLQEKYLQIRVTNLSLVYLEIQFCYQQIEIKDFCLKR